MIDLDTSGIDYNCSDIGLVEADRDLEKINLQEVLGILNTARELFDENPDS